MQNKTHFIAATSKDKTIMKDCNPFTDRICRDIRNGLSKALMNSLTHLDLTPAQKIADTYLAGDLQPIYRHYIDDRMKSYDRALQNIRSFHITDAFDRALVLWDEELFFEVHEILEQEWLHSTGAEKLILQAMIRGAGMYVQLDRDNTKGAASMAAKAVIALECNRSEVPNIFDLDLLLDKLRNIDPVPPKLWRKISE